MRLLLISLLLCPLVSYNQNKRFFKAIDNTKADLTEEWRASGAKLNILNFNEQDYEGVVLAGINAERGARYRSSFIQDSAYNRMCLAAIEVFPKKFFDGKRFHYYTHRYTDVGLRRMQGENKMFRVLTFRIKLADITNNEYFYFDRRNFDSDLQLYKGKTPLTRNPEHKNYVEPLPVDELTEQDFVKNFIKRLKNEMSPREFYSRNLTHIGLALSVDKHTVGRRKIPLATVIVIIGGKQTQKIKPQRLIPQNSADDNSPYTILK